MAEKMRKCAYSHCKHANKNIILLTDKYVIQGRQCFHPDCKHEKDTMLEVIDFWQKNVDKDVIYSQLRRILDRLVYTEGFDADYVLYALKRKYKVLNHPPGLVYAVKDKAIKKDWDFEIRMQEYNRQKAKAQIHIAKDNEPTFTVKDTNSKKKFGDIFGGN